MIHANLRSRLTAADLELVLVLASRGSVTRRATLERRLAVEGPDPLLDEPELFERLLAVRTLVAPSPCLFYYVVVRHALLGAGVTDREIADYLGALLLEFSVRDRANRISWHDDAHHRYLVDIVHDMDASSGERKFRVMLHLGNYSLWLAGLFPHYIEGRRHRRGGPDVSYYDAMGTRGFGLASDHALADTLGVDALLHQVADRFAALRGALNQVSGRMFFPLMPEPPAGPPPLH